MISVVRGNLSHLIYNTADTLAGVRISPPNTLFLSDSGSAPGRLFCPPWTTSHFYYLYYHTGQWGERLGGIYWVEAIGAKYSTLQGQPREAKLYLVQHVNSAKARKPCSSGTGGRDGVGAACPPDCCPSMGRVTT